MRNRLVLGFVFALLFAAPLSLAQSPTASGGADPARIAKLEQATAEAKSSGDNAWMLTSSALVLMMTGPGPRAFLRRAGP